MSAPSDAFFKRSSTQYTTVAAWDTAISQTTGDEIISDAGWTGGASPTSVNGYRLSASSSLRRAGTDLNIGNYGDAGNRAFAHPPSIGAWEAADGDIATARTAASTRTAATARTAASARTAR